MQNVILEGVRYWEPRRIAYNAVLAMVVLGIAWYHHPSLSTLTWQPVVGLLLMAVVANGLYCTAYVADVFFQMSKHQRVWKEDRWVVWAVGTIFAVAIFCITRD